MADPAWADGASGWAAALPLPGVQAPRQRGLDCVRQLWSRLSVAEAMGRYRVRT